MRVPQRSGLFSGVALLACATVLLEVALTRLYAALFGAHVALLVPALALLGAGLGGVLLYLAPSIARPPSLFAHLAALSALASGAAAASAIVLLNIRPITDLAPRSLLWLALGYATSTLPFVLVGAALAAAVRHVAHEVPRLYLLDLVGAAVGGLTGLAAVRAGAPRAMLIAALALAAASVFFYVPSRRATGERRASGALVATFVLGMSVLLAGDLGSPWAKLGSLRWTQLDKVELQTWSEEALVTVDRPRQGSAVLRLDGTAASAIVDGRGTASLPLHPDDMAYVLHRDQGPVLVLGAGGGRDIRAALKAGQKEVVAVESDRGVVFEVMRGRYADFSDHLFDKPEVRVVVADGRTFARQGRDLFRNIVVSATDSAAASAAGALSLSSSRLLTVEAFRDLLARLTPEGTLVVNRGEGEFDRLLALSTAALRRADARVDAAAAPPKDHLFACGSSKTVTLLIKRTPLSRTEIDALRRHCRKSKFTETFAPDRPQSGVRARLVGTAGGGRVEAGPDAADALIDLTPPTDDRPFFSYNVPLRRLAAALRHPGALHVEQAGLFALFALLAVSVALGVLCLLLPFLVFRRRASAARAADPVAPRRPALARPLLFFAAIGAGFALVELAFAQHLAVLLGHPSRALPTVMVLLLVSAGAGGVLTARVTPASASGAATTLAELLVAAVALGAAFLGPLLEYSLGFPLGGRLALTAALLVPLGLLLGSQAPLGVKLVAARSPALLPWCWGLSAVAGAIATAVGMLVVMTVGYSVLLLGAGLAYLVAAAAAPRPAERPAVGGPDSNGTKTVAKS